MIEVQHLQPHLPEMAHDLPSSGRRLTQRKSGYDATIVSGKIIRRPDAATGAWPGKLVRSVQTVEPSSR